MQELEVPAAAGEACEYDADCAALATACGERPACVGGRCESLGETGAATVEPCPDSGRPSGTAGPADDADDADAGS